MNVGTRLGPYEIVSRIGEGGMGEVWRANDTRLGRSVALKVLPAEFASNVQLRSRFEREARTISQLNHPHICTLFDVGENYLVMELLEGESLADRILRGPLPLAEVLRYGAQIADALDKAHRNGIVHRDLKPGNVMVTRSGAKLLDFGLAKAPVVEVSVEGATEHMPLTAEGAILGTFQYMAPEQLEGQNVDARTDIFALGALLYEMACGKRAFDGKTKTSLIASIVAAEPQPLSQLQPLTPPALEHVVRKCLAKDPESRWQSAHDVAEELRWIAEAGSQAGIAAPIAGSRRLQRRTWIASAIAGWLLALAALAGAWVLWRRVTAAERPLRSELAPAANVSLAATTFGAAVLSPDGSRLAFLTSTESQTTLWLRDLATGRSQPLEGTEGAGFPFWAPDSASIGFFADGKLKIVSASGGGVQAIADAPAGRGGAWSRHGVIVFAPDIDGGLFQVAVSGGAATPLTRPERATDTHRNPTFLPDGERLLYSVRRESDANASVRAASIRGGVDRQVLDTASNVAVANGYLLFYRGGNVVAQKFDERDLEVEGPPRAVAEGVDYFNSRDVANFSASRNGLFLYRSADAHMSEPVWVTRGGAFQGVAGPPGPYRWVRVSPDGHLLLLSKTDIASGNDDLWMTDLQRGTTSRVTFASAGLVFGAFSPDGKQIAVSTFRSGTNASVWTQSAMGGGTRRDIYKGEEGFLMSEWSPDGRFLVGTTQRNRTGFDIATMDVSTGKLTHLLIGPYDENLPSVSPDGKWMAYMSNETGRTQIYVTSFPDVAVKIQISRDGGGGRTAWSRDGSELFYGNAGKLYSVRRIVSAVALLLLYSAAHQTLALRTPQTIVETDAELLRRGASVQLHVRQPGPGTFTSLRANLVGEEYWWTGMGRRRNRHSIQLGTFNVFDSGPFVVSSEAWERTITFVVPDVPHVSDPKHAVQWNLEVWGKVERRADFLHVFPVHVSG